MLGTPDWLSVAFRAVSLVLLLQATGIVIFLVVFASVLPANSRTLIATRTLGRNLALSALVFVTAHFLLEPARMAGELAGALDPAMQMMALRSGTGAGFAMRMVGLILIAMGLSKRRYSAVADRPWLTIGIASLGVVLCIFAFVPSGHTSDNPHRGPAALLLILHLVVVAFWLGALAPLFLATTHESRAVSAHLIARFSVVAGWVVPGIALAGLTLTALLVPGLTTFRQPYGQLLLTKMGLFAVLMALAACNKYLFGPACAEESDQSAVGAFRRTVALEYVGICAVVAVTAVMTTFFSPAPA